MSEAYKQQWNRMSASRRLLICLTAIAKHQQANNQPLTISIDALEAIQPDEGIVQSFEGNMLMVRYAPNDSAAPKTFLVGDVQAVERKQPVWPIQDSDTPQRLMDVLKPNPLDRVSTLDDAEMAAREAGVNRQSQLQREAAERRSRPLPVTQPPHPPS